MKRILTVMLMIALIASFMAAALAEIPDTTFLLDLTEAELIELRDEIDGLLTEIRKEAASYDDDDEVVATRSDPALVGQTAIFKRDNYDDTISFQIVRSIRGEAANALLKSFNKYNVRRMEKGTEWFIVMFKIEALECDGEKFDISQSYFQFVSSDGVQYKDKYVSDNPAEIKNLYTGSTQYAWFASKIKIGDNPLISYERSSESVWFNPNERVTVDTSGTSYSPLKNKDTGEAVEELQYRLMEYGLYTAAPSGKYDAATTKAVKALQKAFNLKDTGTADEETLQLIYSGKSLPK